MEEDKAGGGGKRTRRRILYLEGSTKLPVEFVGSQRVEKMPGLSKINMLKKFETRKKTRHDCIPYIPYLLTSEHPLEDVSHLVVGSFLRLRWCGLLVLRQESIRVEHTIVTPCCALVPQRFARRYRSRMHKLPLDEN